MLKFYYRNIKYLLRFYYNFVIILSKFCFVFLLYEFNIKYPARLTFALAMLDITGKVMTNGGVGDSLL